MSSPTTTSSAPPFLDGEATRLLDEFAVSQAAELARNGAYDRAESILRPAIERPVASAAALDLQARIFAQQGRMGEAEILWRKVLEREPGNAMCQAALTRIHQVRRQPMWIAILWPAALAVTVVVLCIALIQFQSHRQRAAFSRWDEIIRQTAGSKTKPTDAVLTATLIQIEAQQSNQVMLASQQVSEVTVKMTAIEQLLTASSNTMQRLESTLAENTRRNEKQISEAFVPVSANSPTTPAVGGVTNATQPFLWPTLALPGIRQMADEAKMRVIFDDGLFDHGTHFKLGAKERLTATIKALAQSNEQLVIEVVGYSDGDLGFFGPLDGYSTGLKRAATTVDFIRSLSMFSRNQLRASSEGSAHLPFPADSAKGGAKNRTVVLQISRDEK